MLDFLPIWEHEYKLTEKSWNIEINKGRTLYIPILNNETSWQLYHIQIKGDKSISGYFNLRAQIPGETTDYIFLVEPGYKRKLTVGWSFDSIEDVFQVSIYELFQTELPDFSHWRNFLRKNPMTPIVSVFVLYQESPYWILMTQDIPLNPQLNVLTSECIMEQLDIESNQRAFEGKSLLIITDWGVPCYGGGEEFMFDVGYLCSMSLGMCVKWLFFQNYENNRIEKLMELKCDNVNERFELNGFPGGWSISKIESVLKEFNPDWVIHQGSYRKSVAELTLKMKIPFLTGICFWNEIVELCKTPVNSNIPNYLILKNAKSHKIHPFYSKYSQNTFSVSSFVSQVVQKITKKTPPFNIYSISLSVRMPEIKHVISEAEYITIINLNQWKGGVIAIAYLQSSTNDNPPLYLVDSDKDNPSNKITKQIYELVSQKNLERKNPHVIVTRQDNLSSIYQKTRILLIPSRVDETFCRIAYEGIYYEIPMISSTHGNLPHLLGNAAIYCDDNPLEWVLRINSIYRDVSLLNSLKWECCRRKCWFNDSKFIEQMREGLLYHKPVYCEIKIGVYGPWADQGLGIQTRNYAKFLRCQGFRVAILSYKSYFVKQHNRPRVEGGEWEGFEVYEYPHDRDHVTIQEFDNFYGKSKITHFIIPETCHSNVFRLARHARSLNIRAIAVPNMEIVRSKEILDHANFDELWLNYDSGKRIWDNLILDGKLGENPPIIRDFGYFHDHTSMWYERKSWKNDRFRELRFFCIGGLNSITRKSIPQLTEDFITFQQCYNLPAHLYIYIQGHQVPKLPSHKSITLITKHIPYYEILQFYHENDVCIHMGTHEGLGIGFYEAVQQGCPVLTMDCEPNNEIVINGKNGWTIDCTAHKMTDNTDGIVMEHHYDSPSFIKKLRELCLMSGYEWNQFMIQMESYMYEWIVRRKQKWIERFHNYLL